MIDRGTRGQRHPEQAPSPGLLRARPAWRGRGAGILLLGLALALAPASAGAGDLQFSASVGQTTVGLGQQFQLVLTVQGQGMLSAPRPTLPALPDIDVLGSSSSQSTNISIMNGRMTKQATVSFIYALSAKKLGRLTIPPCKLTYQGKDYQTQPIEITVLKAAQGQATPAPSQPGAPPTGSRIPLDGNLYLSVVPGRHTVFVGEPVKLEVALCSRFQVSNGGWAEMPSFDGFWAEKVFDADKFDFQPRTINGKSYGVSLLKKVVLFPLSAGKLTIKPMVFNVAVTQPPRDFFDMFGSTQTVRLTSKPVVIEVQPLPEKDKPKSFAGGVGQFTLSASLDKPTSTNSEPINLTAKVSGTGNIRMIDKPEIAAVPGLKILDPEIKDQVQTSGGTVRGTRTFRFPIIPQSDGKYQVAPIEMAYFDPQAKAYKTLQAGPFEFSASGSAANAPLAEATGLKVLGTDINYIKPDAASLSVASMDPPWWPNLLYLLSLGMVGGALWYRTHSERLLSDRGYARKTRSSALVRRRLRQAEKLLKKRDEKGFYAALTQAVVGYVGDRFNIETHAMTRDQLRAEMERLQISPETSSAVIEVVDQCEIARFSPSLLQNGDPRHLFERARVALGRL